MTKVFLANPTPQNQIINVRLPESRKALAITIPMGQQRELGNGSFETSEIDAIVAQLGPYGLYPVDEVKRARTKVTYILSIRRPVTSAEIMFAVSKNRGELTEEGKKRRLEAAVAANAAMNTDETPLNRMEMSVEEATPGSAPSEKPIGEGFRIDNTLNTSENKPKPRRTARG